MKRAIILLSLFLAACVHESATPLGNNLAQVDVSAAPVYGRSGAQRIAMENAAKATLKFGYSKFIVLQGNGWNESTIAGGSHGSFSGTSAGGTNNISGSQGSVFSSFRNPESNLIIRMFHKGDKGASNAVDAQAYLDSLKSEGPF